MSRKIKISEIKQDDQNFNLHSEDGLQLLQKSVDRVGIIESITVSSDDKIISGNARQKIISKSFDEAAIVIETDGKTPVILKRTDIKSGTKEFYEAALLANTVAKKNINLDLNKIEEVAIEQYGINVEELGVEIYDLDIDNNQGAGESDISSRDENIPDEPGEMTNMVAFALSDQEAEEWLLVKEKLGVKRDKNAFFELIIKFNEHENGID